MKSLFSYISRIIVVFLFLSFSYSYSQIVTSTDAFGFSGGSQSWTVPTCVTSVDITVGGGQGGGATGGNGSAITLTLTVTPGQVFNFIVGSAGTIPTAGWPGGGNGLAGVGGTGSGGGGGTTTLSMGGAPFIVAAGGGGAGGGDPAPAPGGGGGCPAGIDGAGSIYTGTGGVGATIGAGGAGGPPWGGGAWGTAGSIGQGGNGAFFASASGGGGGGGVFGGGGGGSDFCCAGANGGGAGGGGSSLIPAGGGCVPGGNAGNGIVSFTYVGGINPVATNTGPYCGGDLIQLNSGGGTDYAWTGPGGFTSNLQNPTISAATVADSGTYWVIVTDSTCPGVDSAFTVVAVEPMPTLDLTADQTICDGSNTVAINFTGIVPGTNYNWTNDNTGSGLAGAGLGDIPSFTGTATVTNEISTIIVIPSLAGCTGIRDTFAITVLLDPSITVSADTTICQNGTAFLNALGAGGGGGPYIYHWSHTADTQATQIENPTVSGVYTVYVESINGCESDPVDITVTMNPPLTGTITPWDTVCPTYDTDITANVMGGIGAPYTFTWSNGEFQTGPLNSHTFNVAPAATTTYTVTITDECETTPLVLTTDVRVSPLPVPAYTVLDPEQCEPAIFHIVNSTDPTLSQYNYWLFDGDQQFINQDTIVTEEMYAGLYDLQMIITSFEGCVDSLTFIDAIDVKSKPVADFKHSPNPVLMFNTDVLFTNYSWQGYSYQWSFEDGYPSTSTQEDVQVQFPDGQTGAYDIQLITTSELGCVDTMQYELVVFPEVLIYAPNTFTPDGDEFNQGWQVFMEGIDVYDFELLIFNRWGQTIWESNDILVPWDGTFNGKIVQEGTYQWIIRATDILNDNKYVYNGHVNLIK